jgi:hypothetical protein
MIITASFVEKLFLYPLLKYLRSCGVALKLLIQSLEVLQALSLYFAGQKQQRKDLREQQLFFYVVVGSVVIAYNGGAFCCADIQRSVSPMPKVNIDNWFIDCSKVHLRSVSRSSR